MAPRRPGNGADAAASWPVLARLPFVEATPASRRSTGPVVVEPFEEPALHQAEGPPTRSAAHSLPGQRRAFVDQPHAALRTHDWPNAANFADSRAHAYGDAVDPAPARDYQRVDLGARRPASIASDLAPAPHVGPTSRISLAAILLQLQARLAPHAGIAATVALLLAAAALGWFSMSRPRQPLPYEELFAQPSQWPAEQAAPAPAAPQAPGIAAPAEGFVPQFTWKAEAAPPTAAGASTLDSTLDAVLSAPLAAAVAAVESSALDEHAVAAAAPPAPTALPPVEPTIPALSPVADSPAGNAPSETPATSAPAESYPATPFSTFNAQRVVDSATAPTADGSPR